MARTSSDAIAAAHPIRWDRIVPAVLAGVVAGLSYFTGEAKLTDVAEARQEATSDATAAVRKAVAESVPAAMATELRPLRDQIADLSGRVTRVEGRMSHLDLPAPLSRDVSPVVWTL